MRYIGQVPSGARILVPLCGKSLDLGWLKGQGYNVVGVELADQDGSELLEKLKVKKARNRQGRFETWETRGISV